MERFFFSTHLTQIKSEKSCTLVLKFHFFDGNLTNYCVCRKMIFLRKYYQKSTTFSKNYQCYEIFHFNLCEKKKGKLLKKNKMVNVTSAPQIFFPPKFETFPSFLIHFSIKQLMRSLIKGHFKGKLTQGTSSGTFPWGEIVGAVFMKIPPSLGGKSCNNLT